MTGKKKSCPLFWLHHWRHTLYQWTLHLFWQSGVILVRELKSCSIFHLSAPLSFVISVLWPMTPCHLFQPLLSSLPSSFSFYSHSPTPFVFFPVSVSLIRPFFPVFFWCLLESLLLQHQSEKTVTPSAFHSGVSLISCTVPGHQQEEYCDYRRAITSCLMSKPWVRNRRQSSAQFLNFKLASDGVHK